ncbi:MAG: hypothetical protein WD009_03435 [Phycisphaeraceae bacterium]
MRRGTLNDNKDAIATFAFRQNWLLDGLGNWAGFDEDLDGGGGSGWDLEQTRAHSDANEITSTTETTGSAWAGTDHDAAGNMVEMPRADDPTDGVEAVYDAWNRLVELIDESTQDTLAKYQWDGMGRRIVVEVYDEGDPDETRHYYTQQHQIVEVRVDGTSSSDLAEQYVWGAPGRYVDELILRDRDTTGNGELNERLYALQDTNFNVVAIVDDDGSVQERYRYAPHGQRTVLNANFSAHPNPHHGGHSFGFGFRGLMHDDDPGGLLYHRAGMMMKNLAKIQTCIPSISGSFL